MIRLAEGRYNSDQFSHSVWNSIRMLHVSKLLESILFNARCFKAAGWNGEAVGGGGGGGAEEEWGRGVVILNSRRLVTIR